MPVVSTAWSSSRRPSSRAISHGLRSSIQLVRLVGDRGDATHGSVVCPRLEVVADHIGLRRGAREELGRVERRPQPAVEQAVEEPSAAARDVDDLADQVGVHPVDVVLEAEVDVGNDPPQPRRVVVAQVLGVEMVEERATR